MCSMPSSLRRTGPSTSTAGIDWFEVQESLEKNLEEGRAARGASTITQQLAKNLFLSTSKDPLRKLREVIITLLMEKTAREAEDPGTVCESDRVGARSLRHRSRIPHVLRQVCIGIDAG